ncbi:hypothetical protein F4777DRAFT_599283 [Nemania sp. FL0916]|nr:hypothetical protein F4777DRAFT_599283 [Nemania sp. FL0916]
MNHNRPIIETDKYSDNSRSTQLACRTREKCRRADASTDGRLDQQDDEARGIRSRKGNQGDNEPTRQQDSAKGPTALQRYKPLTSAYRPGGCKPSKVAGVVVPFTRGPERSDLRQMERKIKTETPSRRHYESTTRGKGLVFQIKPHEEAMRYAIHSVAKFEPHLPRIVLFTDGSEKHGNAGAGFTYKLLLGDNTEADWVDDAYALEGKHSCTEAEIAGIYGALRIAYDATFRHRNAGMAAPSIFIFTDSFDALQNLYEFHDRPERKVELKPLSFSSDLRWALNLLMKLGCRIELNWVPGHVGVEGNVRANKLAKVATQYAKLIREARMHLGSSSIFSVTELFNYEAVVQLKQIEKGPALNSNLDHALKPGVQRILLEDFFRYVHDHGWSTSLVRTSWPRKFIDSNTENIGHDQDVFKRLERSRSDNITILNNRPRNPTATAKTRMGRS